MKKCFGNPFKFWITTWIFTSPAFVESVRLTIENGFTEQVKPGLTSSVYFNPIGTDQGNDVIPTRKIQLRKHKKFVPNYENETETPHSFNRSFLGTSHRNRRDAENNGTLIPVHQEDIPDAELDAAQEGPFFIQRSETRQSDFEHSGGNNTNETIYNEDGSVNAIILGTNSLKKQERSKHVRSQSYVPITGPVSNEFLLLDKMNASSPTTSLGRSGQRQSQSTMPPKQKKKESSKSKSEISNDNEPSSESMDGMSRSLGMNETAEFSSFHVQSTYSSNMSSRSSLGSSFAEPPPQTIKMRSYEEPVLNTSSKFSSPLPTTFQRDFSNLGSPRMGQFGQDSSNEQEQPKMGNLAMGNIEQTQPKMGNLAMGNLEKAQPKMGNLAMGNLEKAQPKMGNLAMGNLEKAQPKMGNLAMGNIEQAKPKMGNLALGNSEKAQPKMGNLAMGKIEQSQPKMGNLAIGNIEQSQPKMGNLAIGNIEKAQPKMGNLAMGNIEQAKPKMGNLAMGGSSKMGNFGQGPSNMFEQPKVTYFGATQGKLGDPVLG